MGFRSSCKVCIAQGSAPELATVEHETSEEHAEALTRHVQEKHAGGPPITYGTALEFIADTLYDTQTYAAAGQTQLTYFQTEPATLSGTTAAGQKETNNEQNSPR